MKWKPPFRGHSGTLAQARPNARAECALAGGGAFRDGANCLLRILSCKRLLSRSLSFDAFVVLPMPARGVSLPEVQAARLLQAELYDLGATFSGDIPAHWPSATNPPSEDGDNYVCRWPPKQPPLDSLRG